jgi:hypothetical protein
VLLLAELDELLDRSVFVFDVNDFQSRHAGTLETLCRKESAGLLAAATRQKRAQRSTASA